MMKNRFLLIIVLMIGFSICACKNDNDEMEVPCRSSVVEGVWDVIDERTRYYEVQDSTVESIGEYNTTFESGGAGFFEIASINHFTWSLQCSPNHLLINGLGGPPLAENPNIDPMQYTALSNTYLISKITANEIQMFSEYYLGEEETLRKVTRNLVYTRID